MKRPRLSRRVRRPRRGGRGIRRQGKRRKEKEEKRVKKKDLWWNGGNGSLKGEERGRGREGEKKESEQVLTL